MLDEEYSAFIDGDSYITALRRDKGVHHAEGEYDWYSGTSPYYIYLGAKFKDAVAGGTYTTTKLTIELFWE